MDHPLRLCRLPNDLPSPTPPIAPPPSDPSALGFIGIHWPAHRDASRRIATHRHIGIVTHRRFRPAALGPWGGFTSPPSATHRHPRTHRRFFQSTRRSHAHKVSPGEAQRDCGQARAPSTKHTKRIDWPKRNLAALGRKSAIFGQFGGSCTRPPIASHRVPSRPIATHRQISRGGICVPHS